MFSNTELPSQPKEFFKYILLDIRTSYEKIMQKEQTTHETIRSSDASQVSWLTPLIPIQGGWLPQIQANLGYPLNSRLARGRMWDPASVQATRHLFNCGADSGFYAQHHKPQEQTPQKQQIKNNYYSTASQNFSQTFILEDLKGLRWESKIQAYILKKMK